MVIRKTTLVLLMIGLVGILAVKEFRTAWEATEPVRSPMQVRAVADPIDVSPPIDEGLLTSLRPDADPPKGYEAILTKNLFRPLGWEEKRPEPAPIRRRLPPAPVERPVPPPSTDTLQLTGIIEEASGRIALIEDEQAGEGYFLRLGASLKDAKIQSIDAESLLLVRGDTRTRLTLGQQIRYDATGHLLLDSVEGALEQEVASRAPLKEEQADLIERLRARRRRELGQP